MSNFIDKRDHELGHANDRMVFNENLFMDLDNDGTEEVVAVLNGDAMDSFKCYSNNPDAKGGPISQLTYEIDGMGRAVTFTNFISKADDSLKKRGVLTSTNRHIGPNELDNLSNDVLNKFISKVADNFENELAVLNANLSGVRRTPEDATAKLAALGAEPSLKDTFNAVYDMDKLNDLDGQIDDLLNWAQLHFEYLDAALYIADHDFTDEAGVNFTLDGQRENIAGLIGYDKDTPLDLAGKTDAELNGIVEDAAIDFLVRMFDEQAQALWIYDGDLAANVDSAAAIAISAPEPQVAESNSVPAPAEAAPVAVVNDGHDLQELYDRANQLIPLLTGTQYEVTCYPEPKTVIQNVQPSTSEPTQPVINGTDQPVILEKDGKPKSITQLLILLEQMVGILTLTKIDQDNKISQQTKDLINDVMSKVRVMVIPVQVDKSKLESHENRTVELKHKSKSFADDNQRNYFVEMVKFARETNPVSVTIIGKASKKGVSKTFTPEANLSQYAVPRAAYGAEQFAAIWAAEGYPVDEMPTIFQATLNMQDKPGISIKYAYETTVDNSIEAGLIGDLITTDFKNYVEAVVKKESAVATTAKTEVLDGLAEIKSEGLRTRVTESLRDALISEFGANDELAVALNAILTSAPATAPASSTASTSSITLNSPRVGVGQGIEILLDSDAAVTGVHGYNKDYSANTDGSKGSYTQNGRILTIYPFSGQVKSNRVGKTYTFNVTQEGQTAQDYKSLAVIGENDTDSAAQTIQGSSAATVTPRSTLAGPAHATPTAPATTTTIVDGANDASPVYTGKGKPKTVLVGVTTGNIYTFGISSEIANVYPRSPAAIKSSRKEGNTYTVTLNITPMDGSLLMYDIVDTEGKRTTVTLKFNA